MPSSLPPASAAASNASSTSLASSSSSSFPASSTSLPLAAIHSITDIAQVQALLSKLEQEEKLIESELDGFLQQHERLEAKLETLQFLAPKLQVLENDARQLSGTIAFTCQLAENVSSKVRELDVAQSNVQLCIARVEDIVDLKNCVEGVSGALAAQDYEKAAFHINRYLSIDPTLLSAAQLSSPSSPDSPAQSPLKVSPLEALKSAEKTLREAISEKFDTAVSSSNVQEIQRFFKLFPLINLHEQGLDRYSAYLCGTIAAACDTKFREMSRNAEGKFSQVTFVDLLMHLFSTVAKLVETHQPAIETHYGPGHLCYVLRRLQAECDKQAQRILSLFLKERDFRQKVKGVQSQMNRVQKPSATGTDGIDPKDVDILLVEVALLSNHTQSYNKFVRKKAAEDIQSALPPAGANVAPVSSPSASGPGMKTASASSFIVAARSSFDRFMDACELNKLFHDLVGNYIILEEFHMKHSVLKAISLDKHEAGSLVSAAIDDVFYVLKKCTRRALSSGNVHIVCAMLNHANNIIETDLKGDLQAKLRSNLPSVSTDLKEMFQARLAFDVGGTGTTNSRMAYLVLLNNTEVSSDYTVKLMKGLEQESGALFPLESDKKKIESLLSDMSGAANNLRQLLQSSMEQFCYSSVFPRIKSFLDSFGSVSFVLNDEQFAENDVNDPFVLPFINEMDSLLSPFKSSLTETNYDSLVGIATQYVTTQLEAHVMSTQFNQLGGLQFDKDIRTLTGYFSGMTQKTIRDKFARLSQICTLLVLEKVSDASEYWNSQISWRLTPSEVHKVLALRVDFRKDEIQRLRL